MALLSTPYSARDIQHSGFHVIEAEILPQYDAFAVLENT
jgi:hypothetical protein